MQKQSAEYLNLSFLLFQNLLYFIGIDLINYL